MDAIPEQDPVRIESRGTGPGIPDVWCGDCAIETKCLASYPKGDSSLVVLKHKLTMPQYRWLNRRWRAGFKAFVVLQVKRTDWYLFTAPDSFVLTDKHEVTKHQLPRHALWFSKSGLNVPIFDCLTLGESLQQSWNDIQQSREQSGLVARWKDI